MAQLDANGAGSRHHRHSILKQVQPIHILDAQNPAEVERQTPQGVHRIAEPSCPTTSDRIFVPVTTDRAGREQIFAALYDTGAAVSCVSETAWARAKRAGCIVKQESAAHLRLQSANGLEMPSTEIAHIRAYVAGRLITAPFVKVPSLSAQAIIGMNVIRRFGLVVNREMTVCYADEVAGHTARIAGTGTAVATKRVHIAPFQAALVDMSFMDRGSNVLTGTQDLLVEVGGFPCLATSSRTGKGRIYVHNPSEMERVIERNELLGTVREISRHEPFPIERVSALASTTAAKSRDHMSSEMARRVRDAARSFPGPFRAQAEALFKEFHMVFSETKSDIGKGPTEHDIALTSEVPAYTRQYSIPEEHMDHIKDHVRQWLKLGIVEHAKSPYNAPIFCVPKKEGQGWRVVLDYRKLNAVTVPDKYSLRCVEDCINEIGRHGSQIFSTLDLTSGFWQMPLSKGARRYTAFTVPGWGQYQWRRGAVAPWVYRDVRLRSLA